MYQSYYYDFRQSYFIQLAMGGWLVSGACCCCVCCCQQLLQSFKRLLGTERVTKLFHIVLVLVFMVPSILIFFFINKFEWFFQNFKQFLSCPDATSLQKSNFQCIGPSVIYRLSFTLLCLFLLLSIFMFCRNRCSMVINEGMFCIKYLIVVALFIGLLFTSNGIYVIFAEISKYFSILFLILQIIILIDLFYLAGIKLVKKFSNGQNQYACYLIILTIIFESLAIGVNIFAYIYFGQCTLWVNIINSIIIIGLPVLQIFNFNHQNSLLTTALVSLYISYLNFIAQFFFQSTTCRQITIGALVGDIVVSTFWFILTMYGSIMGGSGQVNVNRDANLNQKLGLTPSKIVKNDEQGNQNPNSMPQLQKNKQQLQDQESSKYQSWNWVYFHLQMCLASIYFGILLTNWGSVSIVTGQLQQSSFAFWIRIIFSWLAALLYIWTLIVPVIFPNRDFTVE